MQRLRAALFGAAIALVGLSASPVSAGPLEDLFSPADANGVLPIERILELARASIAGTVTEIELEHERGRPIYEVTIMTADNKKIEIEFDARTGAEVSRKVKWNRRKKED
jgi:uncharacterized membrane protein YkoI